MLRNSIGPSRRDNVVSVRRIWGFAAPVDGVQKFQESGCQSSVERAGLLEVYRKKR